MLKLLIIEDDQLCFQALESLLSAHEIDWAQDSVSAKKKIETNEYDWALIDIDLEVKRAGLELCALATEKGIPSTIVSGHRSRSFIEEAINHGASEVLSKPFAPNEIRELLLAREQETNPEKIALKEYLRCATFEGIAFYRELLIATSSELPILLTGESGTGKTRLAKTIHQAFLGQERPFIHVNCAEIPDDLAESILFGHVKGAFSGADQAREGLIEAARGGTLFLDEVATLSARVQAKLLKAVEEKSYRSLGSTKEVCANFQLISATCENFEEVNFRQDLLFRLSGVGLKLLALHETKGLALKIAEEFLDQSSRRMIFSADAREYIRTLKLKGNVRELLTGLKRVRGVGRVKIEKRDLELIFGHRESAKIGASFKEQVGAFERKIVERVYQKCGENVRRTLKELEITSSTFYRVMNLPSTVI